MWVVFEGAELGNQWVNVFVSRKGAKVSECIMWDMDCFQARKAGKPVYSPFSPLTPFSARNKS